MDFDFEKYKKHIITGIVVCAFFIGGNLYMQAMRQPVIIQPATPPYSEPDAQDTAFIETEPELIQIYITGEVHLPGLYTLQAGDRIANAVEAAGGMTEDASANALNLAAFLSDAQHIIIPKIGEEASLDLHEPEPITQPSSTKININTATQAELMTLPGVGEVLSQNILAYRANHGPFKFIEEIKYVSRIGDNLFESLRDLIVVE